MREQQDVKRELETMLDTADPLTKAWGRELLRIGSLNEWELWEEALIELTSQIQDTMGKIYREECLSDYDEFLLKLLKLLVLPDPTDPRRDRNKALAMLFEKGTVHA